FGRCLSRTRYLSFRRIRFESRASCGTMATMLAAFPVLLAATAADKAAYNSGRVTGAVVIPLIVLLLAIKCVTIALRPSAITKFALSPAILLASFFCLSVFGAAGQFYSHVGAGFLVVLSVLALLALGGIVVAFVLAILGLGEYSRARERYSQGRAQ